MASSSLYYRKSSGTGPPEVNTLATLKTDLGLTGTNTGDVVKASGAELDTGTDDDKFATAKAIKDSHNVPSVAPGTSGNVLTSNGTDWTSAALPPGGIGDMVLASEQSVTGLKTFDKDKIAMKGTSTGKTVISTANTSATDYTATLPAANGTVLYTDGSAANLTSFPTLNQDTTGSAATLTTPRAIYGNDFDGSAALTQVIGSAYGGTGNGFTKFSGPATSEKTFTLPDANATLARTDAGQTFTGINTFSSILNTATQYVTGSATSVLTGSINPTASTSVTGVGTLFTTELQIGDRITVSGETRTVTGITSNTALTVDTAFSDNGNDTSVDKLPAIAVFKKSDGTNVFEINDIGDSIFRNNLYRIADYADFRMLTSSGKGWRIGTDSNGTNHDFFYIQGTTDGFISSFVNSLSIGSSITAQVPINYGADAQSTDTYVISLVPALTAYTAGLQIIFKANTANTGAASINVNGLGAKTIVKRVNTALANNDILANMFCLLIYDGTNFVLMNPVVN